MKAIQNAYIKQLLAEKRLLINYVYDQLGFRSGAAVAVLGEDGKTFYVGVSRIHPYDYAAYKGPLSSVPYVAQVKQYAAALAETHADDVEVLLLAEGVQKLFAEQLDPWYNGSYTSIRQPVFDRDAALLKAVKHARSREATPVYAKEAQRALLTVTNRAFRCWKDAQPACNEDCVTAGVEG